MSMAQSGFANTAAMQQHPGVMAGHGMGPGHHANPGQPGVVQQLGQPTLQPGMHPGVSGPGAGQVSQGGPTGNMTPGGGGPSAHAMSHLNPSQAQIFQQQQHHIQQQQQQQARK